MHLIGHSLGGMVATLLLPKLGDSILSFANLEGNLVGSDCGASKNAIQVSIEEFELTGYDQMRTLVANSDEPSAASRSKWLQMIPARVFYKTSASIVEWSISEKLKKLFNNSDRKRLFMYGSKNASKATSVAESVEKAGILDTGHFMLLDQPDACYRALSTFITA